MDPTFTELLTGPFRGVSVYPRVARLPTWKAIGLLLVVASLVAAVLGIETQLDLRARVEWLPLRVGVAPLHRHPGHEPGRVIETDRLVLVLDTRAAPAAVARPTAGDLRPRYVVYQEALLLLTADSPVASPLGWESVNQVWPHVSVNGQELIELARDVVPGAVIALVGCGLVLFLLLQLLGLSILVLLYRILFFRGVYVPGFRALFAVGCLASLPGIVLGGLALACRLGPAIGVAAHVLVFGGLFLVGATRVRLGDERPDWQDPRVPPPEAGPAASAGEATDEVE